MGPWSRHSAAMVKDGDSDDENCGGSGYVVVEKSGMLQENAACNANAHRQTTRGEMLTELVTSRHSAWYR